MTCPCDENTCDECGHVHENDGHCTNEECTCLQGDHAECPNDYCVTYRQAKRTRAAAQSHDRNTCPCEYCSWARRRKARL